MYYVSLSHFLAIKVTDRVIVILLPSLHKVTVREWEGEHGNEEGRESRRCSSLEGLEDNYEHVHDSQRCGTRLMEPQGEGHR